MQTPIQEQMLASPTLDIRLSDIRLSDQPDHRWRLQHRRSELLGQAAAAADTAVETTGLALEEIDPESGGAGSTAAGDEFDGAWSVWENTVYDLIAHELRAGGATVLEYQGHLEGSVQLVGAARELDPTLALRAAGPKAPAPDDTALAAAAIANVRTVIASPRPSRVDRREPEDAPAAACETGTAWRIDDTTTLMVTVRLPAALAATFAFGKDDTSWLTAQTCPVAAVRGPGNITRAVTGVDVLAGDFTPGESDPAAESPRVEIAHVILDDPHMFADTAAMFRRQEPDGAVVANVSASCFVDTSWTRTWLHTLMTSADLLIVTVDVAPQRFVPSWIRSGARALFAAARIEDTAGVYGAVAISVTAEERVGCPVIWTFLSDVKTDRIFIDLLGRTAGLDLTEDLDIWNVNEQLFRTTVTHLLATEPRFDLDGLDPDTIERAVKARDTTSR